MTPPHKICNNTTAAPLISVANSPMGSRPHIATMTHNCPHVYLQANLKSIQFNFLYWYKMTHIQNKDRTHIHNKENTGRIIIPQLGI